MSVIYDENFYKSQRDESYLAAVHIIPQLLKFIEPKSVLDIGCGIGTWLNVFKNKYKVQEILGVDGDYVDQKMLQIDKQEFVPYNLENIFQAPKKFDLATSLEVGEHIQEKYADNLVQSLVNASDFIMFSAAMPGQTGTNHINEQFPEYWAQKFISRGYVCIDCIRKAVWNNKEIEPWYRQNILVYIKKDVYEAKYKVVL
jgi:cyclopropane fatty-acyl-phospholipid synthase-like methyltransferase